MCRWFPGWKEAFTNYLNTAMQYMGREDLVTSAKERDLFPRYRSLMDPAVSVLPAQCVGISDWSRVAVWLGESLNDSFDAIPGLRYAASGTTAYPELP